MLLRDSSKVLSIRKEGDLVAVVDKQFPKEKVLVSELKLKIGIDQIYHIHIREARLYSAPTRSTRRTFGADAMKIWREWLQSTTARGIFG